MGSEPVAAYLRMQAPVSLHHLPNITYRLKRGDPERVSIKHIVGLILEDDYLPMIWETFRHGTPRTRWIDFKYQKGRSPWGLTKRVVLKQAHLSRLLRTYEKAIGRRLNPGA